MAKVNIIFPVYNCESFILDSLLSLCSLDSFDFELIIINDGSIDNTWNQIQEIIKQLKIRCVLINGLVNIGCFRARSNAIKASKGDYIALFDSDDISLPGRFEKQLNFLETHKEIWGCGGWAIRITQDGFENGVMDYPPENTEEIIYKMKKGINPIIDSTTMFRRDDFEKMGGYSLKKDRFLVDDMYLWCKSLLNGKKFYNFQEPLIKYRLNHNGNTIRHKRTMIEQNMVIWKEFKKNINLIK